MRKRWAGVAICILLAAALASCGDVSSVLDVSGTYLMADRGLMAHALVAADGGAFAISEWEKAVWEGKELVVYRESQYGRGGDPEEKNEWDRAYALAPSSSTPGDWDLVALYEPAFLVNEGAPARIAMPRRITGYWHRVDPAVTDYTRTAANPNPSVDALVARARDLCAAHPDDAYIQLLLADALIRAGKTEELGALIDAWRPEAEQSSGEHHVLALARNAHRGLVLRADGRNAADIAERAFSPGAEGGMAARVEAFGDILEADAFVTVRPFVRGRRVPNFLETQVTAKVMRARAPLEMLRGRHESATRALAGCYRMGQMYSQDGDMLITVLIGIAVRNIAAEGLALCAIDGCETPEQVQHTWRKYIGPLFQRERPRNLARMGTESVVFSALTPEEIDRTPHFTDILREARMRQGYADARFSLVVAGTAAYYRHLAGLGFPDSSARDQFAPLLGGDPPADPFGDGPIRVLRQDDGLLLYSIGPDGEDGQGAVEYDSSNGTASAGDITRLVPAERRYPVPRQGVRARTRDDLLRQFPNGLPEDVFSASYPAEPLGVTDTYPVRVYSLGPDHEPRDQMRGPEGGPFPRHKPAEYCVVAYDPSNGTFSAGDLWVEIPR